MTSRPAPKPRFNVLRTIAVYKLVKVLLLLALAYGEVRLSDASLIAKLVTWASARPLGVGVIGAGVIAGIYMQNMPLFAGLALRACAENPLAARREDMAADVVAKEKEIATAQAAATGKPPQIAEKIAEGKLKTFFAENVLVEQPFVKEESKTVGELLKSHGLTMVGFVRYKVGEVQ